MHALLFALVAVLPWLNSQPRADDWTRRSVLHYEVRCTAADVAELDRVAELLTAFHRRFLELSGLRDEQLAGSKLRIDLFPPGSTEVQPGFVSMYGGPKSVAEGRCVYEGTLRMPGPTAYDGSLTSTSGHPMDRRYFDKLLIHEVSPMYLELMARYAGGRFNGPFPDWFEQGLEEYLGVFASTAYWKTTGCTVYYERVARERSIDSDFGLNLLDQYNDGMVAVKFIADEFGEAALMAIVVSAEPTFGKKLGRAVGVPFDEFVRRFDTWRNRTIPNGGK